MIVQQNYPNFEWDLKSGSQTIWNLDKWPPFCQKLFEIRTKMSRFQMAGFPMAGFIDIAKGIVRTFEVWSIKSRFQMFLDYEWSDFRSLPYVLVPQNAQIDPPFPISVTLFINFPFLVECFLICLPLGCELQLPTPNVQASEHHCGELAHFGYRSKECAENK